ITVVANFDAGGLFAGVTGMQKDFTLTASAVDGGATQVVTTVDGNESHESALEVPKGSEVKVEAEFHFEDDTVYTTTDSEYVTWTVSPEDSGVTVDENGMVDTSGVTGSANVVVTITATGHGPFEGVTKTTTLTVTPPAYPVGPVQVPGIGYFKGPMTVAEADELGVSYTAQTSYSGEQYALVRWAGGEEIKACDAAGMEVPSLTQLIELYSAYPDGAVRDTLGWPVDYVVFTDTVQYGTINDFAMSLRDRTLYGATASSVGYAVCWSASDPSE
ncbi:hypothetical protein BOO92_20190, partial [Vibrio navarrensis]|uniref:adhesion domain-containing protein n=1 Tax=Vibrio navarrensis TaxID=29495 RepID=UPI0018687E6E